jgi:3-phosphoshikimate 1-carboxyvinyltransferase
VSSQSLTVRGGRPFVGSVSIPGDKSVSHRALLLAALAEGTSTITGLSSGEDVERTAAAVASLGAAVEQEGDQVRVHGGRSRLAAPAAPVDFGNSGTGMRLLSGIAASLPGTTVLTGDDSLRSRPMDRVATPLTAMGADVHGEGERCLPPLTITGGGLQGIEYTPPMASAQVKSAILLAGLAATGETVVREPVATRAYTEEMLAAAGADIEIRSAGRGRVVQLRASRLRPGAFAVPGDPSQAAFWVVAAIIVPGSRVTVEDIDLSEERIGYLHVLERMGARIEIEPAGDHEGSVTAHAGHLRATRVDAAEIPSLDEVPILAVAAATAEGATNFRDVGELRVKESDRLAGTAELVRAFGASAELRGDDLLVTGTGRPLGGARVDARGDHRMAMAAAIAGAAAPGGETTVVGWESVRTSYPGFEGTLEELTSGGAP